MIQLIVDNSYSQIVGLNTEQHRAVKRLLSYSKDASAVYFSNSQAYNKVYLIDKKGFFPTGLLNRVVDFILNSNIPCTMQDLRLKPKPLKAKRSINLPFKPYEAQLNALKAATLNDQGTLVAPTGVGKSAIIALITHYHNVKTLIVVPTLEIKRQLQNSFNEYFPNTSNITIRNIDASDLDKLTDFDCLIIDEAHHSASATYQKLNKKTWTKVYYRYFLTATPFRTNEEENILFEAIAGKQIYKLSYKEAVKKGYIVPIEAYYIDLPKLDTEDLTWPQAYSQLVINRPDRNQAIADMLHSLTAAGLSTLCLVKEIKHGEILKELSGYDFTSGQQEDSREHLKDFSAGRLNSLIGTTGVCGEGVDTKPCEYIIVAGLGKSKSLLMQIFGRGVRTYKNKTSCKVILIKDRSNKYTLRHFKAQCNVLKDEYDVTPTKI